MTEKLDPAIIGRALERLAMDVSRVSSELLKIRVQLNAYAAELEPSPPDLPEPSRSSHHSG